MIAALLESLGMFAVAIAFALLAYVALASGDRTLGSLLIAATAASMVRALGNGQVAFAGDLAGLAIVVVILAYMARKFMTRRRLFP
jgi:membrane protein implicated in regulation of membrane protease activity